MKNTLKDSIATTRPATGANGQVAHPLAVAHQERLQREFYPVGKQAWCLVGNGLSNQSFVEGPEGIIAIDSGESIEEMREALGELRKVTRKPIVACIYTHFHYVNGTRAILEEHGNRDLQIYGHAGIAKNLSRFGGEVAPRSNRGLVHQFGIMLPPEGEDGLLHCGLGRFYRNPDHAPFTAGYVPAQFTFTSPCTYDIAGLRVHLTPAPSDATDSITIWIPALKLCINNLVWPSLFNIYAIRGEEYRDPRVLLRGIDHILGLQPESLLCAHGPPISGAEVMPTITRYRDSIQFIWDQSVRGINQGLTLGELTSQVQLPQLYKDNYFTQQLYGLVEHHVRQIHSGLFGWFDEDESHLFPLPTAERSRRLIKGFGGRVKVRQQAKAALRDGDYRWGLELATWLVRSKACTAQDKQLLANLLRGVAQQTSSANIRNWCLTRALELEDVINLDRHRQHRFSVGQVMAAPPTRFIETLRVLLNPAHAEGLQDELTWQFPGGHSAGLLIRNQVAIPTDGGNPDLSINLSHETWAQVLAAKTTVSQCLEQGVISLQGKSISAAPTPLSAEHRLLRFLQAFDHDGLA